MVCTVLPKRNTRDHYTHLTCKLGHWTKWDHYKHPLPSHSVPCWDGVFSLDHTRMCQQGLFKCQCVYDFYIFAWAVQVRPLHASYLKTGSLTQVRPLQASLIISLCALLGWCFLIRSSPWVSIWAPKGSVSLWFVQFWLGRTSETTAHTLLENWITGWSETITSTPYHITVYHVGMIFSH